MFVKRGSEPDPVRSHLQRRTARAPRRWRPSWGSRPRAPRARRAARASSGRTGSCAGCRRWWCPRGTARAAAGGPRRARRAEPSPCGSGPGQNLQVLVESVRRSSGGAARTELRCEGVRGGSLYRRRCSLPHGAAPPPWRRRRRGELLQGLKLIRAQQNRNQRWFFKCFFFLRFYWIK